MLQKIINLLIVAVVLYIIYIITGLVVSALALPGILLTLVGIILLLVFGIKVLQAFGVDL